MHIIRVKPTENLQLILSNLSEPTHILLEKGVFCQKIVIPPLCVKLSGSGRETTVITNADYARLRHSDGKEFNTFRTFTVCVTGEKCEISDLTVENASARPEINGQCVALSVHAKKFYGKNLCLKSTQDTLFCAPFPDDLVARYSGLAPEPKTGETYYDGFIPRDQIYIEGGSVQIFEDCKISGNVDFIFGGAEAYFKNCELVSLADARGNGYVSAPSHCLENKYGFTFLDCAFTSGGAAEGSVYLARPWRDYGKSVFINCKLGKHVNGELFDKWNDTYRDRTARFAYFNLDGEAAYEKTAAPWAKKLTAPQANDIINNFTLRKKEILTK